MSRSITEQNHNPGSYRAPTVEAGMLYDRWQDANHVPVPYNKAIRVEVIDNTGTWRLPFRVVRKPGCYLHADKQTRVLQSAVVKLWRE